MLLREVWLSLSFILSEIMRNFCKPLCNVVKICSKSSETDDREGTSEIGDHESALVGENESPGLCGKFSLNYNLWFILFLLMCNKIDFLRKIFLNLKFLIMSKISY